VVWIANRPEGVVGNTEHERGGTGARQLAGPLQQWHEGSKVLDDLKARDDALAVDCE
jgi:hypothetical protein